MKDPGPNTEGPEVPADIERRLQRYRRRLEAEGRTRSVILLDLAIRDIKGDED